MIDWDQTDEDDRSGPCVSRDRTPGCALSELEDSRELGTNTEQGCAGRSPSVRATELRALLINHEKSDEEAMM